eukprot:5283647-Prorocentrum_lima.AAC.1
MDGGLCPGSKSRCTSPGDPCGVVPAGENPNRPGTCELAPGVDIVGGVLICGSGGIDNPT